MEMMGIDGKERMGSDGDGWCGCQSQDSIETLQHALPTLGRAGHDEGYIPDGMVDVKVELNCISHAVVVSHELGNHQVRPGKPRHAQQRQNEGQPRPRGRFVTDWRHSAFSRVGNHARLPEPLRSRTLRCKRSSRRCPTQIRVVSSNTSCRDWARPWRVAGSGLWGAP